MASSADSHGNASKALEVAGDNGDSGSDGDESGKSRPAVLGRGDMEKLRGTAPSSVHMCFGGKGKGKSVQLRAVGPGASASHSISLPCPSNLALTSHASIGTDGTFEDSDMSALFESSDSVGNPLKATKAMSFATDGTQTDPSWLDCVKAESVVWRA